VNGGPEEGAKVKVRAGFLAAALIIQSALGAAGASAAGLSVAQVVALALAVNPRVRAAKARWQSATHSVTQNYAPADPLLGFFSVDSPTNGFDHASLQTFQVSESFQFPGKAILQGNNAWRNAEIARLSYEAIVRDVRTRTKAECYQLALDTAMARTASLTVADLERIAATPETKASASYSSAVTARLGDSRQRQRRFEINRADDATRLNALLDRRPDEPLEIDTTLELKPIPERVDDLIERAFRRRQEILQLALQSKNAETALKLARLEYAPDYTVGYYFDHYLLPSDAPAANLTQTHSVWVAFNLPLFFWMKQNEDVTRAGFDLEAAREDLNAIRIQTAARITILHRHAQFDYLDAVVYRDSVVPQSRHAFETALAAYRAHHEDFATVARMREQLHEIRGTYLQAVNRVLADRIALEHEVGEPLPKQP
jgi:outer membrane protein, heavy metal efflux system